MWFQLKIKNKEILEKFRSYVLNKYGTLYGVFSEEVEKALEYYLESQNTNMQKVHAKIHEVIYNDKTKNKLSIILTYLLNNGYERIDLKSLREFIIKRIGTDKRTINKYIKLLISQGFISVERQLIKNTIFLVEREKIRNFLKVEFSENGNKNKGMKVVI